MKLEAVILDWAGTTVDFGCFAPVQAFLDGFAAFGIHPTLEEVRAPMGLLKWDHIHTMMQMPRISAEWEAACEKARAVFEGSGADYTIKNLGELPELLDRIDRTL